MAASFLTDLTVFKSSDTSLGFTTTTQSKLEKYCDIFEAKYLRRLLGDDLYLDMVANKTVTKYTELAAGKTYTDATGRRKQFRGVKEMLRYLVYFHYIRDTFINTTTAGTFEFSPDDATKANISLVNAKLIEAWNTAVCIWLEAYDFIANANASTTTYSNWDYRTLDTINHFGL